MSEHIKSKILAQQRACSAVGFDSAVAGGVVAGFPRNKVAGVCTPKLLTPEWIPPIGFRLGVLPALELGDATDPPSFLFLSRAACPDDEDEGTLAAAPCRSQSE